MSKGVTIEYLQRYIRAKDYHEDPGREFFLKLAEEVGELGRAIRLANLLGMDCSLNVRGG